MRKWRFRARHAVATVVIATLACVAGLWGASELVFRRTWPVRPEAVRAGGPETVPEGARLSRIYGCSSCHGAGLRGNLFNDNPYLVRNHAPNLTLIAAGYSDAQLAQAIRQGVRPTDGQALWGMPSAVFHAISDNELAAVLAYVRAQPIGGARTPRPSPGLRARLAATLGAHGLAISGSSAAPGGFAGVRSSPALIAAARRNPPADLGLTFAAGRHIAATVCTECHGSDLGGDRSEGSPDLVVAGAYGREDFRRLLRTGVPPGGRDLGEMSEVAREDFRLFTDAEIDSLHAYLQARARLAPG